VKLYRLMKVDVGDVPKIGTSFGMLGVRPPGRPGAVTKDIDVDENGNVHPGTDGMSTWNQPLTPDRKHALWEIESETLGSDLAIVESPKTPGRFHIVPAREMSLDEYQDTLASTQYLWQRVQ
jgi:hypothetical protein